MENKKLILVTGAGAESQSVARALRASGRYQVKEGTLQDIGTCYGVFGATVDQRLLNALYGSNVQHVVLLASQGGLKMLDVPTSFVRVPFYYEDLLSQGLPRAQDKLAAASMEDIGPVVTTIFDHPKLYIGRTVNVVGTDATAAEYAALATKVLGVKVQCNGAQVQQSIPNRQLALIESYGLNPNMQTFELWLQKNKKALIAQACADGSA